MFRGRMDPTSHTRPLESDYNHKMTHAEITNFIKMRASNDAIFTGKRNSAIPAWRAIRKELGLQRKLTTRQLKRKWENYKRKYIACKAWKGQNSQDNPNSWPWFNLMDQAITGCLAGTARILNPSLFSMDDDDDEPSSPIPMMEACQSPKPTRCCKDNVLGFWARTQLGLDVDTVNTEQNDSISYINTVTEDFGWPTEECEVSVQEEERTQTGNETVVLESKGNGSVLVTQDTVADNEDLIIVNSGTHLQKSEMAELDKQIAELEKEREMLEREQADFDRERLILERERELLNREKAAVECDRITLENSRASIDRERAALERDRAILDRDRALIERDRDELLKEKDYLMQCKIARSNGSINTELDPNRCERKERLIALLEKLVDKL